VPEPFPVGAHQLIGQCIDRCRVGGAVEFTLRVGRTQGTDDAAPKPPRQGAFGKQVVPPGGAPSAFSGQHRAGDQAMLAKRLSRGMQQGGHAQWPAYVFEIGGKGSEQYRTRRTPLIYQVEPARLEEQGANRIEPSFVKDQRPGALSGSHLSLIEAT